MVPSPGWRSNAAPKARHEQEGFPGSACRLPSGHGPPRPLERRGYRTAKLLIVLASRYDARCWPVSTVRGKAAIRPESGVKATCQGHCSTDAIDPKADKRCM